MPPRRRASQREEPQAWVDLVNRLPFRRETTASARPQAGNNPREDDAQRKVQEEIDRFAASMFDQPQESSTSRPDVTASAPPPAGAPAGIPVPPAASPGVPPAAAVPPVPAAAPGGYGGPPAAAVPEPRKAYNPSDPLFRFAQKVSGSIASDVDRVFRTPEYQIAARDAFSGPSVPEYRRISVKESHFGARILYAISSAIMVINQRARSSIRNLRSLNDLITANNEEALTAFATLVGTIMADRQNVTGRNRGLAQDSVMLRSDVGNLLEALNSFELTTHGSSARIEKKGGDTFAAAPSSASNLLLINFL